MTTSSEILEELRALLNSQGLESVAKRAQITNFFYEVIERLTKGLDSTDAIRAFAADFEAESSDSILLVDASSGPVVVTLGDPDTFLDVTTATSKVLYIKKVDATGNAVSINPSVGTIDGAASYGMTAAREGVIITSDGDDWQVLATTTSGGGGGGGVTDHGALTGLGDDDHTQYLLASGTRALSGDLDLGTNNVTNVGTVDGRDVSADGTKLDTIETGATADQTDAEVPLSGTIGSPTIDQLVLRMDVEGSPGVFNGGGISDDLDGTVTVAAGAGLIRAVDNDLAEPLLSFEWSATPITPVDNDMNYIYVDYNAGSPIVTNSLTEPTDRNTNLMLGTVYREGTTVHITQRPVPLTAVVRDLHRHLIEADNLRRATGAVLSETGTRNIALSAGVFYLGLDRFTTSGFDSSGAGTFSYWYRDGGGGWTEQTAQTQISNSQYDDGSGTLASIGSNRYGVAWVYIALDGDVEVLYGRDNYRLADAVAALAPNDVPPRMGENHATLAGKIIIQQGASAFTSTESAFRIQFTGSGAYDHGDLTGLGDDDHTQYLLVDGTRAMSGDLDMGTNNITNVGTVDGRDVSADGTKLDGIEAGADVTDTTNVDAAGAVIHSDFSGSNAGALTRLGSESYGVIQHNLSATTAPTINDDDLDGYSVGSLWVDVAGDEVYFCADSSVGAAVWQQAGAGAADHGALTGLTDDDHTQYLLVSGVRAMTGGLDMGSNSITNVVNVDGRDVSADGTKLDGIESNADVTDATNVAAAGAVMDNDFSGSNAGSMIRTGVATYDILQHNLSASAAPTVSNDNTQGYAPGSLWVDTTNDEVYFNADAATGAAVWQQIGAGGGVTDHGALTGLTDDDHTQYLLVDGTRAMSGALDMGTFDVTNVGTVDGRDLSVDGAKLDGIEAGATADQTAAEVPFTPNGDIAATNTQAAIVEVRDDTDIKLGDKVELGGQIGGTISTPDVRGIRETSGPTLLTLGSVADGEYLVRSGSTLVGGTPSGGGSSPTLDTLTGFTSGNRYDAAANGYAGVTTGFFFGALVEVRRLNTTGGQSIWNNVNFGVDGWGLNIESSGRFQAYFIDTGGAQVASQTGFVDLINDPAGTFMASKYFIALGQVIQNGANNDIALWVNGQRLSISAGTNPYAPVTDIAQIGAGPFGNVAADTGIGGVMYFEGTLTDDEILDWFHACYDARDLVTNGHGMTIFSVKRGSPGATWTESDGTGPDFNRVGSLTTVNRNTAVWG